MSLVFVYLASATENNRVLVQTHRARDVGKYRVMDLDTQLIVLFVFFLGVGLCFWRIPQADRWHVILCFIAAAIWGSLLWRVPSLRTLPFVVSALTFFGIGVLQPFQGSFASRFRQLTRRS